MQGIPPESSDRSKAIGIMNSFKKVQVRTVLLAALVLNYVLNANRFCRQLPSYE